MRCYNKVSGEKERDGHARGFWRRSSSWLHRCGDSGGGPASEFRRRRIICDDGDDDGKCEEDGDDQNDGRDISCGGDFSVGVGVGGTR